MAGSAGQVEPAEEDLAVAGVGLEHAGEEAGLAPAEHEGVGAGGKTVRSELDGLVQDPEPRLVHVAVVGIVAEGLVAGGQHRAGLLAPEPVAHPRRDLEGLGCGQSEAKHPFAVLERLADVVSAPVGDEDRRILRGGIAEPHHVAVTRR